jgi:hypothetical protein
LCLWTAKGFLFAARLISALGMNEGVVSASQRRDVGHPFSCWILSLKVRFFVLF